MHAEEPAKILLVDDTTANLDVLRTALQPKGFTIMVATSGEGALNLIGKTVPDLIMMDVMMPGLDGFETVKMIKQNEAWAEVPIIFLTAKVASEDIINGFDVGAVDYIVKPFIIQEVLARVDTHIRLSRALKELDQKNNRLLELNQQKNQLLGIVSHDLRNPLAAIKGFSEVLIEDGAQLVPEESEEFLTCIRDTSVSMFELIEELLDLSAIESGDLSLNLTMSSLKQIAQNRIKLFHALAKKKNLNLDIQLDDVQEQQLDPGRISQVIDNFISNAIKFSPKGKVIKVYVKTRDGCNWFSVQDEGPGFTEKDKQKIFKPFQKLSARPTGDEASHGLGLMIAKRMIEAHHGTIELDSEHGKGATLSFYIPLTKGN